MHLFTFGPDSTLAQIFDIAASVLFIVGSFLVMVAGLGIARFPDLLARMHAATKPQSLGLAMLMTGLALEIRTGNVIWTLVLVVVFQLITAPVSAHMVGRAGYRTGRVTEHELVIDELTEDLDAIARIRETGSATITAATGRGTPGTAGTWAGAPAGAPAGAASSTGPAGAASPAGSADSAGPVDSAGSTGSASSAAPEASPGTGASDLPGTPGSSAPQ